MYTKTFDQVFNQKLLVHKFGLSELDQTIMSQSELVEYHDYALAQTIISMRTHITNMDLPPEYFFDQKAVTFDVPATWWDHFKETYKDKWWMPFKKIVHKKLSRDVKFAVRVNPSYLFPEFPLPKRVGNSYRHVEWETFFEG